MDTVIIPANTIQDENTMSVCMKEFFEVAKKKIPEIKAEADIRIILDMMPEENGRMIFSLRWGLDDNVKCYKFEQLAEKLGGTTEEAKAQYKAAEKKFYETANKLKYAKLFESYDNLDVAVGYGKLLREIWGEFAVLEKRPLSEIKEKMQNAFLAAELTGREVRILTVRFGLADGRAISSDEIAKAEKLCRTHVLEIVRNVIREKLRKTKPRACLDIVK